MSWWDKHYMDPKPAKDCRNLCARCRNGYPVDAMDGPYYCDEHGTVSDEVTECEDYEFRFSSSATICMEELLFYKSEFEPVDNGHVCGECHRYSTDHPRRKPWCCACYGPGEIEPDRKACKLYWDRAEQEQKDREEAERREIERAERWKQNENNPPAVAEWRREYDLGPMPFCPNCHEPLYEFDQCYFCGQKIEMDDALREYAKPPEVEHMDCFSCGGKGTIEFIRAKGNGHRHGHCTACGMTFME